MRNVCIVGAGPAGVTLAYLLATRGIDVTLLERRRGLDREFRGEILLPSGVSALHSMGLGDLLRQIHVQIPERFALYLNKRPVFQLPMDAAWFANRPPLAFSQAALLEAVLTRITALACFRFVPGARVQALQHDAEGRVTGVVYADDEGAHELQCDLVVGCDGRQSFVRRVLDLPAARQNPPMDIVWCKVPSMPAFEGVRAYAGRGHLLVVYKTWDGNLQLGWVIMKGQFKALRGAGISVWVREMQSHVSPDLAQHLAAHADRLQKPFLLVSESDRVQPWSVPGALLLGDAAHTMSPVGGQGINIALRDVIVAANHLVPALRDGVSPARLDALCRQVEAARSPEVAWVQRMQAQPPKLMLNHAWWAEPIRALAGKMLSNARIRTRLGPRLQPMLQGVTPVSIEI